MKVSDRTDLYKTQPVTFSSIAAAKSFTSKNVSVDLYAICFRDEEEIVPDFFTLLPPLETSIHDVFADPSLPRLPFIQEILSKAADIDTDYIVYSNADIALMPYFYETLAHYINQGYDAISVNRRRLSYRYMSNHALPILYSDMGLSHPGFDCFVFKKELMRHLELDNLCLGIPFVEVALVHHMGAYAQKPLYLTKEHLTFHIGAEVMPKRNKKLYSHNRKVFFSGIYPRLKPLLALNKMPYYTLPIHKRAVKWMLNPSLFTLNYIRLEGLSILQKLKAILDELRWRILER